MKIAIIGTGLIGGSIALKMKTKGLATYVYGVDFNEKHLEKALELGIIDEKASLEYAISQSQVILIAIPVDATAEILPIILSQVNNHQLVIDTGSTKWKICSTVENSPNRERFVAFHPMWGTENSGPNAATSNGFSGKAAVICDQEKSAPDAIEMTKKIIETLEMYPIFMSSHDHDIHTAYISHISHITSYALANTVLEKEREEDKIFQLASSGFSSTVRLAKSHPEMWVPIFRDNRDNVLDVLNEHISQLRKFKSALEKENYEFLQELISNANKIRGILK